MRGRDGAASGESDPVDERGDGSRSQSEVIGIILLFGFVIVVGLVALVLGALALEDVESSVRFENTEHSMREVDSRLSRVAFSDNRVESLDITNQENVTIRDDSYIRVTVNGTSACQARIEMGSIVTTNSDGRVLAYEGGGVWERSAGGTIMVSPPDLQYYNGTVNFPLVSINSTTSSGGGLLRAEKNVTRSRMRSRQITQQLTQPASACQPPGNVTILVKSRYYEAWGRYLEETTNVTTTVDDANGTAAVTLQKLGPATGASIVGGNITANTEYVAEVKVNGTGYHTNGWHLPIGFLVEVEDEGLYAFSPNNGLQDRQLNMSYGRDDMNNPLVAHERGRYPSDSISVPAGKNFSVRAVSYICDPDEYPGGSETARNNSVLADTGQTLPDTAGQTSGFYRADNMSDRCVAPNLQTRELRNLSSSGNSVYLEVYNSSQNQVNVGNFESAPSFQREPSEVFEGSGITYDAAGSNRLDLDDNEAVFIYELNEPQASGDYNDAIVTVRVREQGAISPSGSFSLKITVKNVEIDDG
jgi:hypothetical protein